MLLELRKHMWCEQTLQDERRTSMSPLRTLKETRPAQQEMEMITPQTYPKPSLTPRPMTTNPRDQAQSAVMARLEFSGAGVQVGTNQTLLKELEAEADSHYPPPATALTMRSKLMMTQATQPKASLTPRPIATHSWHQAPKAQSQAPTRQTKHDRLEAGRNSSLATTLTVMIANAEGDLKQPSRQRGNLKPASRAESDKRICERKTASDAGAGSIEALSREVKKLLTHLQEQTLRQSECCKELNEKPMMMSQTPPPKVSLSRQETEHEKLPVEAEGCNLSPATVVRLGAQVQPPAPANLGQLMDGHPIMMQAFREPTPRLSNGEAVAWLSRTRAKGACRGIVTQ